jgi:hypothetical protein
MTDQALQTKRCKNRLCAAEKPERVRAVSVSRAESRRAVRGARAQIGSSAPPLAGRDGSREKGAGAPTHRGPLTRRRSRRERELGDLGQHSAGAGRDAELLAHLGERDVCEREVVDRREVAGALGTPPKGFGEEIGSAVAG